MKFNEKLIILRKEKGLSQEEFGNIFNVSRQSVSKWELGQTQPDVDKIKKICEFYNVSFDYLLNDDIDDKILLRSDDKSEEKTTSHNGSNIEKKTENIVEDNVENMIENENNKSQKSKYKIPMALQIILFIIFTFYIANSTFKAIVFANILAKNDTDNIESYKYNSIIQKEFVFPANTDKILSNTTVNKYICYKNDIYFVWDSYEDDEENCIYYEQVWNYYNGRFDKKGYKINTKIKYGIQEQEYYYTDEGNFLNQDSTFEFISDEIKKEFSFANILNPFKFYKITDDGNIVIEKSIGENIKYSKEIYYIDIKSGFLTKEEKISNDEIVEKTIYEGYEINTVEDKDIMFDEELKQEIIEKSKITMEKNLRELENEENLYSSESE